MTCNLVFLEGSVWTGRWEGMRRGNTSRVSMMEDACFPYWSVWLYAPEHLDPHSQARVQLITQVPQWRRGGREWTSRERDKLGGFWKRDVGRQPAEEVGVGEKGKGEKQWEGRVTVRPLYPEGAKEKRGQDDVIIFAPKEGVINLHRECPRKDSFKRKISWVLEMLCERCLWDTSRRKHSTDKLVCHSKLDMQLHPLVHIILFLMQPL